MILHGYFLKEKLELNKVMMSLIKDLKSTHGTNMKYARYINAGEHKNFERACEQKEMGVQFECAVPGSPQQNGRVQRKFATLSIEYVQRSMVENFPIS